MMWNNLSGGVCSSAMALLFPKVPNVIVNTGGNYPWAWRNVHKIRNKRIKVIVLSSMVKSYPTYFDYIRKEKLMPFYMSCCDKAKEKHLDQFYITLPGRQTVNVGFCEGEEKRAERLSKKDTKWRKFNFPVLEYPREHLKKIVLKAGLDAKRTGCWFCPKQENPPKWAVDKFTKLYE
jgi:hypothetical protein